MKRLPEVLFVIFMCAGCTLNSQGEAVVPLFVAGADFSEPVMARGDVPVELSEAKLAFGPLYLCAGASAGDLCDTARLEWLQSVVVNAMSEEPQEVGPIVGTTGPVRSYMYDLGISSQLTRDVPFILDAAAELGDASFVVSGTATVDEIRIPFRGSLSVQQTGDTELGVPVVRKSTSEDFSYEVREDTASLLIRFDPSAWIRGLDFQDYVTREACSDGGPGLVCDGTLERTCEGGTELSSRDCGETGQVCLPDEGCAEELVIRPDTTAHRSLRNALLTAGRPRFEWKAVPSP